MCDINYLIIAGFILIRKQAACFIVQPYNIDKNFIFFYIYIAVCDMILFEETANITGSIHRIDRSGAYFIVPNPPTPAVLLEPLIEFKGVSLLLLLVPAVNRNP